MLADEFLWEIGELKQSLALDFERYSYAAHDKDRPAAAAQKRNITTRIRTDLPRRCEISRGLYVLESENTGVSSIRYVGMSGRGQATFAGRFVPRIRNENAFDDSLSTLAPLDRFYEVAIRIEHSMRSEPAIKRQWVYQHLSTFELLQKVDRVRFFHCGCEADQLYAAEQLLIYSIAQFAPSLRNRAGLSNATRLDPLAIELAEAVLARYEDGVGPTALIAAIGKN